MPPAQQNISPKSESRSFSAGKPLAQKVLITPKLDTVSSGITSDESRHKIVLSILISHKITLPDFGLKTKYVAAFRDKSSYWCTGAKWERRDSGFVRSRYFCKVFKLQASQGAGAEPEFCAVGSWELQNWVCSEKQSSGGVRVALAVIERKDYTSLKGSVEGEKTPNGNRELAALWTLFFSYPKNSCVALLGNTFQITLHGLLLII